MVYRTDITLYVAAAGCSSQTELQRQAPTSQAFTYAYAIGPLSLPLPTSLDRGSAETVAEARGVFRATLDLPFPRTSLQKQTCALRAQSSAPAIL